MNNVCAVVVTFNRLNLLKECIAGLQKQVFSCDIFVVNNCSEDGTESYLKENGIDHISTEENVGGAGGFSLGVRKAVEKGYQFVWLMDDDCIPQKNSLEQLMNAGRATDYKYGFLSSRVVWTDGSDHAMNKINKKERYADGLYLISQATFVSILFPADIIRKVGLPIKDFFIWGDDIEYTRRIAIRNRIPSFYVENSVVVHKTKNNIGSKIAFDDISNINRYRYAYRNECYLYRREGIRGRIYYFLKCMYNLFRILFLAKDNKVLRTMVLLQGINEGRTFDPRIEYL